MFQIPKTLKKDLVKFLNIKIDLRNPVIKNFIKNENGLEKYQQQLDLIPEYKRKRQLRTAQKKFQDKKRNEIKKIKEEEQKIQAKKKIKNFIRNNYDKILELTKPDGEFKFYPLDFGDENKVLFFDEILKTIQEVINSNPNKNELMTDINIDGTYYTLHNKTIFTIRKRLIGIGEAFQKSSDLIDYLYQVINANDPIEFKTSSKTFKNEKKEGAFFPYYHKTKLNLERYQISPLSSFNEDVNINTELNNDNCLIYSLRIAGLSESKLNPIKNYVSNSNIPICKLKEICEEGGFKIKLITQRVKGDEKHKLRITKYGTEGIEYNINCVEGHYFINEKTNYTSYYIKNYNELENKANLINKNYIYDYSKEKGYSRDQTRTINSFDLILLLLENKEELLELIDYTNINSFDEINKSYVIDENKSIFRDLYFDPKYSCKKYEKEESKEKEVLPITVFDFETYKDFNNHHIPYLCCFIDNNGFSMDLIGPDCGKQLLDTIKEDTILMAHNAKYDVRFLIQYLSKCSEIVNGGSFITFSGYYGKHKIIIKDSYKLIANSLKDLPEMFLSKDECKEIKKEVMPYDLYNQETLSRRFIPIEECLKHFKSSIKTNEELEEDKKEFIKNCEEWDVIFNNKVDILEYSAIYCRMDCKILKNCYSVFREWCLKDFKLDINNILTIPSLAEKYFKNEGCFEGCYSLSGLVQLFISQAIVGGRTMMSNNKKEKVLDQILNDFDAVSLYPSAMSRIKGFLKGVPKVIKNLDYNEIKNYDGYFIQIKILKVGIKRAFPLMSYKTEEGIRDFNNDMEGKIMIVDKTTAEDLINFQDVSFEVLKGYYYDEGFNNKIVDTIKYLFSRRKELKKKTKEHPEGNKSEIIYKLIMNSGYGKLITKPHETKIKFFDRKKEFDVYKSRNYNIINNYVEYVNGKYRVEINDTRGNQFNYCHLGSEILSMSKRIMNEVICTAEDNNLKIYYQDTDSIHINDEDIVKLKDIYESKYNRQLIGKNMGQFHSDFKMEVKGKDINNIVSTGLIMLGKKSYIDRLRGEDKEGNYYYDYHIRLKGINEDAIKLKIKQDYKDAFELYEDLYKGEKINFDLTAEGSKCCFEFGKSYNIITKTSFKREVCFI
jgi:hypothetical protein